MTELELLRMRHAQNEVAIADLMAENKMIEDMIRQIVEEEILEDHPYWTAKDELWGRDCKITAPIREQCLAGDRSLQMYAEWKKELNTKYVVPLVDDLSDVPEEIMTWYQREQTEHFFPIGWGGGLGPDGYFLDEINLEEGGELEGYCMIWSGNAGPVEARNRFEGWWTQPDIMDIIQAEADRVTESADFYYRLAEMRNTVPEFMAKRPWYIPEDAV